MAYDPLWVQWERSLMKDLCNSISILLIVVTLVSAAQARPDLIVSKVTMIRDKSGIFVEKVEVTVTNGCRGSSSGPSDVLVTFKENEQPGAKAIYYVGNGVRALKGGESQTQTFNVAEKKIVFGRYVFVEADPYKKVAEASEDNNWRTLFPEDGGTMPNSAQCEK